MIQTDARGLAMSGADGSAAERYETALGQFQCYVGDPVATLDAALAERPDFAMALTFKAYLFLAGTEAAGLPVAAEAAAALRALPLNEREGHHLAAIEALLQGRWSEALVRLEDLLLVDPRDSLAMQVAHLFDFYHGDARNLRDRVARRLHAWSPQDSGYHAVLAMHAFGLEESGDYGRAEELGRRAVELNQRDGWAYHAVAHVLEMRNDPEGGIAWLEPSSGHWSPESFFDVHNWWHLALYHLELDRHDEVLKLYDGPIREERSKVVLDMLDASAMLWRLKLRGLDAGPERWGEVAGAWEGLIGDGLYCFNDVHALMAFVSAGRDDLVERQLATLRRSAAGEGSNAAMAREVGVPVGEAVVAMGRGDPATTVERLQHLRPVIHRFGGSHAQRDIFDLTLIEAAKQSGNRPLLAALANERVAVRPHSPLARRYRQATAA